MSDENVQQLQHKGIKLFIRTVQTVQQMPDAIWQQNISLSCKLFGL